MTDQTKQRLLGIAELATIGIVLAGAVLFIVQIVTY